MSTQTQAEPEKEAFTLPHPDQAHATITDRVLAESYFAKLASFNILPQTPEEYNSLLHLGRTLFSEPDVQFSNNRFAKVAEYADSVVNHAGRGRSVPSPEDQAVTNVIHKLACDNDIYLSMLSLQKARAEQLQQN